MHATQIKKEVLKLYLAHPFPQWDREERHHRLAAELCRYRFMGLDEHMRGARFLDVGCGTGNRSMLAAKHYGVKEFVGLDHSTESLEVARRVAAEEQFDRFTPVNGDVLALPFPDASFDIVVSWGVLHHTSDPYRGLSEMVRVCRPGGFVGVFLYNKYNHWRHNLQKARVSQMAGEDIEERFKVAHRLYGTKPVEQMTPAEVAIFYDQYCHPHKSDHTLGETLRWFDELGLDYQGSYPPLSPRDALACLKYRAELSDEFPVAPSKQWLLKLARVLPVEAAPAHASARPSLLTRAVWQAGYAWMGRHGQYSGGSALAARKRIASPA